MQEAKYEEASIYTNFLDEKAYKLLNVIKSQYILH